MGHDLASPVVGRIGAFWPVLPDDLRRASLALGAVEASASSRRYVSAGDRLAMVTLDAELRALSAARGKPIRRTSPWAFPSPA